MAYLNKEWTDYLNSAVRQRSKRGEFKIYVAYGSPMWVGYKKAERELYKRTFAYKLKKLRQAIRVLFAVVVRSYR